VREVAVATVVALLVAVPVGASVDVALPPAPFAMQVSVLAAGSQARIVLEPRAAAGAIESFDLYLVRIPSGPPFLRYLGPEGGWSETPAPYRRDLVPGALAPIVATWREEGPPGFTSVLAVFTRRGIVPSNRQAWLYQPLLQRARIGAGTGAWDGAGRVLGPLALATLVGLVLVLVLPREPTPSGGAPR
jgi:hypothetical protein